MAYFYEKIQGVSVTAPTIMQSINFQTDAAPTFLGNSLSWGSLITQGDVGDANRQKAYTIYHTLTMNKLLTASVGLVATTGNIVATLGNITATAGDIVATAGDIVATAGDIVATAGDIVATAGVFDGNGSGLNHLPAIGYEPSLITLLPLNVIEDTPTSAYFTRGVEDYSDSTKYKITWGTSATDSTPRYVSEIDFGLSETNGSISFQKALVLGGYDCIQTYTCLVTLVKDSAPYPTSVSAILFTKALQLTVNVDLSVIVENYTGLTQVYIWKIEKIM